MIDPQELKGKAALISGGGSGINLGIAKRFAQMGANVAVFGRNLEKAQKAAEEIKALGGGDALGLSADVRLPDAVQDVVDDTVKAFGKLDIVVAGAAGNFPAPLVDISPKGFKTVVDIDLLGTYNLLHTAFAQRNEKSASFIAITAPQAVLPYAFQAHACAAKAGVNMLVKCMALEWGKAGVRVNAISPGPIKDTEGMARLAPTPEANERVNQSTALGRQGDVDDIARIATFLSSDAAAYVTGGIFNCDGGTELGDASHDMLTSWKANTEPKGMVGR